MAIELKDGTTTEDPRLDRVEWFDERSREFPVRALTIGQPRRQRSWTWRVPAVLDQGQEGACVGFGWTHLLGSWGSRGRQYAAAPMSDAFARRLYYAAQQIDPWPGGAYPGATPHYDGTAVLAGAKIAQKIGALGEYRWAFSLDELIYGIGYEGPAVLGIPWHESMYEPRNGRLEVKGEPVGGHCILAVGVNVRDRTFLLHNSWGPDWGINGRAKISFDDLYGKLIANKVGEVCFPTDRRGLTITDQMP